MIRMLIITESIKKTENVFKDFMEQMISGQFSEYKHLIIYLFYYLHKLMIKGNKICLKNKERFHPGNIFLFR